MNQQKSHVIDLFKANLPLFSALGDSQRQAILLLLADGTRRSVAELTRQTSLSRPSVSHHIKILKNAGLLSEQREGTKRYYCPTFRTNLPRLKAFIEALEAIETQGK